MLMIKERKIWSVKRRVKVKVLVWSCCWIDFTAVKTAAKRR